MCRVLAADSGSQTAWESGNNPVTRNQILALHLLEVGIEGKSPQASACLQQTLRRAGRHSGLVCVCVMDTLGESKQMLINRCSGELLWEGVQREASAEGRPPPRVLQEFHMAPEDRAGGLPCPVCRKGCF